ncbi:MAG: NmrA/HSCARG family protein [Burkholderiales bacterium]|nr:NmrA/HSCARG family protein [Anaerolineae bacterium]
MGDKGKTILVTGATGQQGGAAVQHLLASGWSVRALTRDASSDKSKALAAAGAEVVEGDMDDRAALDAAMRGVYGVFSVQNFWLAGVGFEGEVRQGKNVADAAQAAGVQHLVYTSVGGAERNTGIPHFESKWQIEQHIASLGLPTTILRPVLFMDNFNWGRQPIVQYGVFSGFNLNADKQQQYIAVDDIGWFTAYAFDHPQQFIGQAIELAGDALTEPQAAEVIGGVVGREVQPGPAWSNGDESEEAKAEAQKMIKWFNDEGYEADIPALRQIHPGLLTLEAWLLKTGWKDAAQQVQATGQEQAGWS